MVSQPVLLTLKDQITSPYIIMKKTLHLLNAQIGNNLVSIVYKIQMATLEK